MVRALELELNTYDRQRARLEDEHLGKFVLICGGEIAGIFDDFQSASEYAARWLQRRSYLIHGIGAERTRIPSGLLDGLAAMSGGARESRRQGSMSPTIGHRQCPAGMPGY
jgi:hypothetical protein